MTIELSQEEQYGPWNPGIQSQLPVNYLPLSTIFRKENVSTSIQTAKELSDFTGLPLQELVQFQPQRLVVHELLIRVSADLFVSDGCKYEDLGVNFRAVVSRILSAYIDPHMPDIVQSHKQLNQQIQSLLDTELSTSLFAQPVKPQNNQATGYLFGLFKTKKATKAEPPELREQRILDRWQQKAKTGDGPLNKAIYRALNKIAKAICIKHGRLCGDRTLLVKLATTLVSNDYGSDAIGRTIAPYIYEAVNKEADYRLLPVQPQPVVINIKGASASGKSTMRPRQKMLAKELGIKWEDFALISPDIWRKYLLDYASLGDIGKYAGTLTGDELPIVDKKLDRYMSNKAKQRRMSHLLIDRFRFDSFASGRHPSEPQTETGSNLLTRFGHTVYLVFMITPPEATVERAWKRGNQVGRYKAVDDLLDHNIEAFTGIPRLFFTWAQRKDKSVHYEFLDNSVGKGDQPRTIAFGFNDEMNILDFKCMIDIDRYTKINIDAASPEQVYLNKEAMLAKHNTCFLKRCAQKIPKLNFVDRDTAVIYACMESGKISWVSPAMFNQAIKDEQTKAGFLALAPQLVRSTQAVPHQAVIPLSTDDRRHTLGNWG